MQKYISITKINGINEFDWDNGQGKIITIYTHVCDGEIDGQECSCFKVKTFGKPLSAPWEGDCDGKEYKGTIEWRPVKKGGGQQTFADMKQSQSSKPRMAQDAGNRDRSFALAYAKDIVVAMIEKGAVVGHESASKAATDIADVFLAWLSK